MIGLESKGNYAETRAYLKRMQNQNLFANLDKWGNMGVEALIQYTPVDSGLLEHSWGYRITQDSYGPGIEWFNEDIEGNISVVILLSYGHGTGTGGYVRPNDFVNLAMQPLFDQIANEIWKKVTG